MNKKTMVLKKRLSLLCETKTLINDEDSLFGAVGAHCGSR